MGYLNRLFGFFKSEPEITEFDKLEEEGKLKRSDFTYKYNNPLVLETIEGDFKEWEKWVSQDPRLITVLGKRRCMPKGTLIRTPSGLKQIEEVSQVDSYNFSTGKIESKNVKVYQSGYKQVIKIHTSNGIIECSPNHIWIIKREGQIATVKTKDLKITDHLLSVNDSYG